MANTKLHYQRKWLNKRRGRAYIISSIDGNTKRETYGKPEDERFSKPYIDCYFDIGDCSKTICLDFTVDDLGDLKERKKINAKLALFRESFEIFEQRIIELMDEADEHKEKENKDGG